MKEAIKMKVNGLEQTIDTEPDTPLLYVLRNNLTLNGPKFGCGLGQCGACIVLFNGKSIPSCQIPISAANNAEIVTLEGLADEAGHLHPVQQSFIDEQAAQCGYCTNGMIIASVSLLEENANPTDEEIRNKLQSNICRCGVHSRVIRAVKKAAAL
ncbi:(2Fe-2S)-binding protein [Chondrinema litorale]|uniref:(2Fe-2S)-binding protein n=1 Tax=Chondrinema litorale TaxID=2994555 RepID=UPI0025436F9E|nr:(2Fe-2S)-binding protein [Chondrinema litorale]UZR98228.1 (2Fe-2S)-binding protein [Chondrinema litorale]